MALSSIAPRFLACAGVLLSVTTVRAQDAGMTVFVGVSVLTMESNDALHDQAVVVQGGEITWVGPTDELEAFADARRIDGAGRWLMPGLADASLPLEAGRARGDRAAHFVITSWSIGEPCGIPANRLAPRRAAGIRSRPGRVASNRV